jgi:molecular chaperone GrpE (heat shock protein)
MSSDEAETTVKGDSSIAADPTKRSALTGAETSSSNLDQTTLESSDSVGLLKSANEKPGASVNCANLQIQPSAEDPKVSRKPNAPQTNWTAAIEEAMNVLDIGFGGIRGTLAELEQKIDRRILLNRHNEGIIDNLHAELQKYKADQVRQLLTPILTDLIRLYDDLKMSIKELPGKNNISIEQAVQSLTSFPSDIQYILERQGLNSFEALPGESFDPSRQRVLKRVPCEVLAADRTVVQSIRPGFMWKDNVFRPNFVTIFVYSATATNPPTETDSDAEPLTQ